MARKLVEWQLIDPTNNLVFPWFTHPFLDVLKTWDLKDKYILEYGGGRSTAWWANKAKWVTCIEAKDEYAFDIYDELEEHGLTAKSLVISDTDWTEGNRAIEQEYVRSHYNKLLDTDHLYHYDIVVVDGIFRYECMIEGINLLSDRGGILIVDNWHQDGFLCPACEELVKDFEGEIFPQPGHTDHHGNCWKTAYFKIPPYAKGSF